MVVGVLVVVGAGCAGARDEEAKSGRATQVDAALAYARCMREHGIGDFPDPDASGHFPGGIAAATSSSPRYGAAQKACAPHVQETEPDELGEDDRAQVVDALLAFSRCMREHGIEMSDPEVGSDRIVVRLPRGLAPGDARVEAARETCGRFSRQALQAIGDVPGLGS
jgi:hypothetical protein